MSDVATDLRTAQSELTKWSVLKVTAEQNAEHARSPSERARYEALARDFGTTQKLAYNRLDAAITLARESGMSQGDIRIIQGEGERLGMQEGQRLARDTYGMRSLDQIYAQEQAARDAEAARNRERVLAEEREAREKAARDARKEQLREGMVDGGRSDDAPSDGPKDRSKLRVIDGDGPGSGGGGPRSGGGGTVLRGLAVLDIVGIPLMIVSELERQEREQEEIDEVRENVREDMRDMAGFLNTLFSMHPEVDEPNVRFENGRLMADLPPNSSFRTRRAG